MLGGYPVSITPCACVKLNPAPPDIARASGACSDDPLPQIGGSKVDQRNANGMSKVEGDKSLDALIDTLELLSDRQDDQRVLVTGSDVYLNIYDMVLHVQLATNP